MNTTAINATFGVSEQTVNEAAATCARMLAKWFGGIDEAIAELEADPAGLADIAMRGNIKQRRELRLKAHMNQFKFAGAVLQEIKHPHEAE